MPSPDKADWIDCYRKWEKPLFNVVYRIVWDAAESQDIVQEAFLRCWQKRDRIRADGFKALIFKTALNLARSRRRRDRLLGRPMERTELMVTVDAQAVPVSRVGSPNAKIRIYRVD